MKKNHYKIFLLVFTLSLSFAYLACGKKTDENKQSSQNSNVKTEFGWKDGVSVSDIPARANQVFGTTSGSRITAFVTDVVDYNWHVATGDASTWQEAVGNGVAVGMSPDVLEVVNRGWVSNRYRLDAR